MKGDGGMMVGTSGLRKRRKVSMKVWSVGLVFVATLLILLGSTAPAKAQVSVNIGINAPLPAFVVPAPPPVVVIPGTYVYYAPGLEVDILFYQGYWYRPYQDRWYRSRSYNGPWGFVPVRSMPRTLISLPPHYREIPPGRHHIPYGQLKKNWGKWERERYWHRDPDWRGDYRDPHRNGPDRRDWDRYDGNRGDRGFDHRGPGRHGGR